MIVDSEHLYCNVLLGGAEAKEETEPDKEPGGGGQEEDQDERVQEEGEES